MVLLKESVVIITSIVVVLWLLVSYHQAQQALLWWYSKQWMRMCDKGETIRNVLLQESFIIRRYLELSSVNRSFTQQQDQYYLTTIEKFHHSLKELSDYLSPAYIDESLPLAIRSLLESWELHTPVLNLQLELPTDWHHESHQVNRIVLMTLEELLQIILSDIFSSVSILVSLKPRGHLNELMVQFSYSDVSKLTYISHSAELNYLRHAFKFFTSEDCFRRRKKNTEIWYFRWRYSQGTATSERNRPWDSSVFAKKQP